MTAEEWDVCCDLNSMVGVLTRQRKNRPSDRRFRLLMCAVCRATWGVWTELVERLAVETIEQFADGEATEDDMRGADRALVRAQPFSRLTAATRWATWGKWRQHDSMKKAVTSCIEFTADLASREFRVSLVRCIFGKPFQSVAFDPAWRTSDVLALARGIYNQRAFDRMPILADALQDAGCANDDILNHCRDTSTPHARGCWVVDLVLEKA